MARRRQSKGGKDKQRSRSGSAKGKPSRYPGSGSEDRRFGDRRSEDRRSEDRHPGFRPETPRPAKPAPGTEEFSYGPSIPYESSRRPRPEREERGFRGGRDRGEARDHWRSSGGAEPRAETRERAGAKGGYKPHGRKGATRLIGHFQKNPRGFGFLTFEGGKFDDLFIPPNKADEFFHGDKIEVEILPNGEVVTFQVVDHRIKELFGRFTPEFGRDYEKGAWVTFERKAAGERIYCPKGAAGAKAGDWVKVRLTYHEEGQYRVTGEIIEVLGEVFPATRDVEWVASELGLVEKHPEAVVEEARALPPPSERDYVGRRDLRKLPLITIDGITARDFDDAVYVERIKHGYHLWVAIADVSHYVKEGTRLDEEAYRRATSVYFPERAFHMLPSALSENLCSLRPDEDRLCMVAKISFDAEGNKMDTEVFNAVMRSQRRATYEEIQKEYEVERNNRDWLFAPHFELYHLLRARKSARGSIDFDLPETKIMVDKDGEPVDIEKTERFDSHRLIEEFMIAANESVTEWAIARRHPFIYRVHEEPSTEALTRFQDLAATAGIHVDIEKAQRDPRVLQAVVRQMENHPAKQMLNTMLLRAMKQAVYSSVHNIHYGLASKAYTHFTSPIRRYPDLIVHRMLKMLIESHGKRPNNPEALEEKLTAAADHCSQRERLATQAERESTKLKQARFMIKRLGEEYHGIVNGMTDKGLYIQLGEAHDAPFVEGFVPKESMTDDFYAFNEERMIFYGKRKKRTFRVGDDVRIRVVKANLDRREVEFEILEHTPAGHHAPVSPREGRGGGKGGGGRGDRGDRGGKGGKRGRPEKSSGLTRKKRR